MELVLWYLVGSLAIACFTEVTISRAAIRYIEKSTGFTIQNSLLSILATGSVWFFMAPIVCYLLVCHPVIFTYKVAQGYADALESVE